MATYYSTQATKYVATPAQLLNSNELNGRVRIAYFTYTMLTTAAAGDIIELTKLPANARLLGGLFMTSAKIDAMASCGVGIGTAGSTAGFLSLGGATGLVGATMAPMNDTIARGYGTVTTASTPIIATFLNGSSAGVATVISGHIAYVVD
jgi:hypothetical protein